MSGFLTCAWATSLVYFTTLLIAVFLFALTEPTTSPLFIWELLAVMTNGGAFVTIIGLRCYPVSDTSVTPVLIMYVIVWIVGIIMILVEPALSMPFYLLMHCHAMAFPIVQAIVNGHATS
jgi:hypothetical protein